VIYTKIQQFKTLFFTRNHGKEEKDSKGPTVFQGKETRKPGNIFLLEHCPCATRISPTVGGHLQVAELQVTVTCLWQVGTQHGLHWKKIIFIL